MCSSVSTIQHPQKMNASSSASDTAAEARDNVIPNVIVTEGKNTTQAPVVRFTVEERRLAGLARKMAANQNVLYHGTRYTQSILRTGVLFASGQGVSLTRSPEVAAYFALLPRDDCEERGAILIFDRERLRCRYRIDLFEGGKVDIYHRYNEAEEELRGDLTDVGNYLVGLVSEPATLRSDKVKSWNAERRMQMEARLDDLLCFVPDWRCRSGEHITLNLRKWELARNALFNGAAVEQVATQVDLSMGSVRRLAGRLQQRIPCRNKNTESDLNWNFAQIVLSWDLGGLLKKCQETPNKVTLPRDLVSAFGVHRINALMTYCGMSRDDVLDTLTHELPRLMQIDAQRKTAPAHTEPVPTLENVAIAVSAVPPG
jgi:hypothetical protein